MRTNQIIVLKLCEIKWEVGNQSPIERERDRGESWKKKWVVGSWNVEAWYNFEIRVGL